MLRRRVALLSALFSLMLAVVPGTASSQANDLAITDAEIVLAFGVQDFITVGGHGVCASAGSFTINVQIQDLETGAGSAGFATEQCVAAGERITWQVTCSCASFPNQFRVGDRARVRATAIGAITATDLRELILKKQS